MIILYLLDIVFIKIFNFDMYFFVLGINKNYYINIFIALFFDIILERFILIPLIILSYIINKCFKPKNIYHNIMIYMLIYVLFNIYIFSYDFLFLRAIIVSLIIIVSSILKSISYKIIR